MGPEIIASFQIGITRSHAGAPDLIILNKSPVRTIHKDAVTSEIVNAVSPDMYFVSTSIHYDPTFIYPLNAIAPDQDVIIVTAGPTRTVIEYLSNVNRRTVIP
jgi:hypothetical protein